MQYSIYLSCPNGVDDLLSKEVRSLGFELQKHHPQGVSGFADLKTIYDIALWSRLANRIHLVLFKAPVDTAESLYNACRGFTWEKYFELSSTLWIDFHGQSDNLRHSVYAAQVIKDAIVDYAKQHSGTRPNIAKDHADIKLIAHLHRGELTVSIDLIGYSLHQRGYREEAGQAPIKENLAAALLIRAGLTPNSDPEQPFVDLCCGSGTIVIEAALIKANIAPGLIRDDQNWQHWLDHDEVLWQQRRDLAFSEQRKLSKPCIGYDKDPYIIKIAKNNAVRAGVADYTEFYAKDIKSVTNKLSNGLIVSNPPYGERLEDQNILVPLYQQLGRTLFNNFQSWDVYILTAHVMLARAIGLRSHKKNAFYNGALECNLYAFSLTSDNKLKDLDNLKTLSAGSQMIFNRLKKRLQHLQKWVKRQNISSYRLYDADLPDYAFAIDIYDSKAVVVQEYQAPKTINPLKVERHRSELLQVLPLLFDFEIIYKQRAQQKGTNQYQKIQSTKNRFVVSEGKAKFYINVHDYLDTGLFLDHRLLRMRFAELPKGTKFLNCFCYTATASVQAALAGAITTNVDLSQTYLSWARDNCSLNNLNSNAHQFIRDDCRQWLKTCKQKFDVIFLDPPSFSNSKKMQGFLDIQEHHVDLINDAMQLLANNGALYFSTNLKSFKLNNDLKKLYNIQDITKQTIDEDFKNSKAIHYCFLITFSKN